MTQPLETSAITIRKATSADAAAMMSLIHELALFEKAPNEVINNENQLIADGFGDNPLYGALVAIVKTKVVGMSLYYYRYSTWKGKCLYLEDLIVTENERGNGIGKMLFETTLKIAREQGCHRVNWQVLDWNTPAIDFYRKYGSEFDGEWLNAFITL